MIPALLLMLAAIIATHLMVVINDDLWCLEYGRIVIEEAREQGTLLTEPIYLGEDCDKIEESYSDMVSRYLAIILSLIGGSAITGMNAAKRREEPKDE